jgi:hypothetical protein
MSAAANRVPASVSSRESRQTESPESVTPLRELTNFLTKASSRYVPLPQLNQTCDAVFVHPWFESQLFARRFNSQYEQTERLLELMTQDYANTIVLGIKVFTVGRHRENPERFRLRWSKHDEDFSEVFLISCFGLPDHVAVVPTSYMRRRYGDVRNIEGRFELDRGCPSLLAPFMVHYQDLVKFLEDIYQHASTAATSDLINPTYLATYYCWMPKLQYLRDVMPTGGNLDKLLSMRDLYFACRFRRETMSLSYRGEPGHFMIDGHAVEYWRKSWCRVGDFGNYIQITLLHQLTGKSGWKFLFLEDKSGREALFLPRDLVPSHLIGHARHGRLSDNPWWPQVEIHAESLGPFLFGIRTPHSTAMAIASIMAKYTHQADAHQTHGLKDQDRANLSLTPLRVRTETQDWI